MDQGSSTKSSKWVQHNQVSWSSFKTTGLFTDDQNSRRAEEQTNDSAKDLEENKALTFITQLTNVKRSAQQLVIGPPSRRASCPMSLHWWFTLFCFSKTLPMEMDNWNWLCLFHTKQLICVEKTKLLPKILKLIHTKVNHFFWVKFNTINSQRRTIHCPFGFNWTKGKAQVRELPPRSQKLAFFWT